MAYFDGVIQYVGSHPYFAFLAILLLALSEAIPVIGTMVPGSTLILAISALATTADINPWLLLVAAIVGAILGDGLSYWLGYRYHREILSGWPLSRFPGLIKRSAHFIRRHGITSVFLARFTAVVRAFVPLLAGIMKMSSTHFYVANVLSALVWAPLHIFPGVLAGMAINLAGAHAAILGLKFVAALIVASMAWHVLRDHFRAKIDMQQPTKPKDVPVKEPPMREPERKEPPAREPERKEPPAPPSIDKPPRPSTPPPARLAKPAVLINSTVTPMLRKAKLVR